MAIYIKLVALHFKTWWEPSADGVEDFYIWQHLTRRATLFFLPFYCSKTIAELETNYSFKPSMDIATDSTDCKHLLALKNLYCMLRKRSVALQSSGMFASWCSKKTVGYNNKGLEFVQAWIKQSCYQLWVWKCNALNYVANQVITTPEYWTATFTLQIHKLSTALGLKHSCRHYYWTVS